jgi:putative endonuclease
VFVPGGDWIATALARLAMTASLTVLRPYRPTVLPPYRPTVLPPYRPTVLFFKNSILSRGMLACDRRCCRGVSPLASSHSSSASRSSSGVSSQPLYVGTIACSRCDWLEAIGSRSRESQVQSHGEPPIGSVGVYPSVVIARGRRPRGNPIATAVIASVRQHAWRSGSYLRGLPPGCSRKVMPRGILVISRPMDRSYYVYIMANRRRTVLYTGITNDLLRRVWEHRNQQGRTFTTQYHCWYLVFYEVFRDSYNAISREKQLKAASRRRKIALIESLNPEWRDLYDGLAGQRPDCHGAFGPSQ